MGIYELQKIEEENQIGGYVGSPLILFTAILFHHGRNNIK